MSRARASFVRSAFTLFFGAIVALTTPAAFAGAGNDAALVMDAESGRVLYARSGDALRSPASLTKMMTLYILFDMLDSGRMSLTDVMTASAHAASQKPTKLGLKKGDTLTVEQAIYSLVIQSANDSAVVIAETIGGSESAFAGMMTKRARELGMKRTTFRNASGLPDDAQKTTARDMAVLSRALMRDHPKLYTYFSTTSFTWNGKTVKTHNRVLTSLNGANGIKTGYTKASGFNLTTSVERKNKRLIGVVLGGDSWAARDAEMKTMLEAWFAQLERRPNLIASYNGAVYAKASTPVATVQVAKAQPKPEAVTVAAAEEPRRMAAMAPIPDEEEEDAAPAAPRGKGKGKGGFTEIAYNAPVPAAKPARISAKTARVALADAQPAGEGDVSDDAPVARVKPAKGKERILPLSTLTSGNSDDIAQLIETNYSNDNASADGAASNGDWGIQIGAYDTRRSASDELTRARKSAKKQLAGADESVMEVTNDAGRKFYRARFGSFSSADAQSACKALKAQDFQCVTYSTATASAN